MKKILCVLLIAIMIVVSLAGCGNSSKAPEVAKVENEVNKIAQEAGVDMKVNLGQAGTNLKLPETFPKDIVPVFDGATIVSVIDNKEDGLVSIMFTTSKGYEEVASFYQNVLNGAENFNQFQQDANMMLTGKKEGYEVVISVAKDHNNNSTSGMLDVNYSEMAGKMAKKDLFASKTEKALPDGYPSDILPLLAGDKLMDGRYSESDSNVDYYLTVLSNKTMKEIITGYEAAWKGITGSGKDISSSSFNFQGAANGYSFYINGDYDEESKTVEYTLEINK